MNTCVGCARKHDSWRAYCTNCMQTQNLSKAIESQNKASTPTQPNFVQPTMVTGGFRDDRHKIIQWLDYTNWGMPCLMIWVIYMFVGFFFQLHHISGWDWLVGFILFVKAGNE